MNARRTFLSKSYWYCLVLLLSSGVSFAQKGYFFEHLTTDQGLLANDVFAVFEDSKGYIWIGSVGGLQRFDGYDFFNYTYDPRKGMMESTIRDIMETSNGEIWAGIRGGGIVRVKDNELLSPFVHKPDNPNSLAGNYVEDIVEDESGGFWIATDHGLDYYKDGIFTHYQNNPSNDSSLSHNTVRTLHVDHRGDLWVGTQSGLNRHLGNGRFQRFFHDPDDENSLSADFVHGITSDDKGNLWLAIVLGGLNKLSLSDYTVTRFMHDPQDDQTLGNDIVLDVEYSERDGSLWVGTWGGGLNKYVDGKFRRFNHDFGDQTTILSDNLEDILIDRNGNLWIATFGGGVSRYSESNLQSYLYKDYKDKGMLATSSLRGILATKDGAVWVATHLGVNRMKDGQIETYGHDLSDDIKGLSSPRATVLFEDSKERVWIGNYQAGADLLDNGKIRRFIYDESKPDGIGSDEITDITEDTGGTIWLGTSNRGISAYDGTKFVHYVHDSENENSLVSNRIAALWPGSDGDIWIATFNGLSHFEDGRFTNYLGDGSPGTLPKNRLVDVALDKNGDVWTGYIGGVGRLNVQTGKFKIYDMQDGIGDNIVEEVIVDDNGIVWVGTHSGVSRYVPQYDAFINYGREDGLISEQVVRITYDKWDDELYIGTPAGFFVMSDYKDEPFDGNQDLHLTSFSLINTESSREVLPDAKNQITLGHDENSFIIRYSTLSGDISPGDHFEYAMAPFDDDWVYAGLKNFWEYTYLNPGKYTFHVKLNAGLNEDLVETLIIRILPPWWETWWFRSILLVLAIVAMLLLIKWRMLRADKQKKWLNEEVEKKTRQLKDAQTRLVESEKMASVGLLTAGIAHEINNPLNFIHGSNLALEKYVRKKHKDEIDEFKPFLDGLDLGVERVSTIVKSLNRFNHQSTETKEPCDVHLILENCLVMLQNKLKNRIEVIKDFTTEDHQVVGYEGELHQVFLNILVNASQAIEGEGKITIHTEVQNQKLFVEIGDTGVGIDREDLLKVTSPFYTTKPPGSGTGLGMSIGYRIVQDHNGSIQYDSEKGKGTRATVMLPVSSE